ncbi:hypothetical protein [Argonema antarcticum]|nr:hypothetical protein [Argonema antarcticum]MCL1475176.1 hypothetical protein [Argonema antarcticum A004/B2]
MPTAIPTPTHLPTLSAIAFFYLKNSNSFTSSSKAIAEEIFSSLNGEP